VGGWGASCREGRDRGCSTAGALSLGRATAERQLQWCGGYTGPVVSGTGENGRDAMSAPCDRGGDSPLGRLRSLTPPDAVAPRPVLAGKSPSAHEAWPLCGAQQPYPPGREGEHEAVQLLDGKKT
jgi:hypothetical protein